MLELPSKSASLKKVFSRFAQKNSSLVAFSLGLIFRRIREIFPINRDPRTTHFTLKKFVLGTAGLIPVCIFGHWLGYTFANK